MENNGGFRIIPVRCAIGMFFPPPLALVHYLRKTSTFFQGHIEQMSTIRVSSKTALPVIILALSLMVSGVYWQTGGHPFINLDDGTYVSENPVVLRGLTLEGVSWAFTTFPCRELAPSDLALTHGGCGVVRS